MDVKEVLEQIDIVDFLSQYVELEEKGGEYWGLSPLANPPEKTPSFSVRRESGQFYCFSTGIGGSAVTFLKHYYGISSREAIEKLAKYAGCDVEIALPKEKMAATVVCKKFLPIKQASKPNKSIILPDDYMKRFQKTPEKLAVWLNEGISQASLDKFQVFYDGFSDRLVYPIRNINGKIVNIGGRTLDPAWKEKKLRKYTYFQPWGSMNVIYGLSENMDAIREHNEVIIFEGCKSVLLADTWGIRNTSAILTSHLNPSQMKILASIGCRVVFALDKDVDVRKDRQICRLKQYVDVSYLHDTTGLLDEKDSPVDKGGDIFAILYNNKRQLL